MIPNQKHLFNIGAGVYLNAAYMTPNLKRAKEAGHLAIDLMDFPQNIQQSDFFSKCQHVKASFAKLIQAGHADRIALIPSVSYGVANAVNNIKPPTGSKIVVIEEQFPSNIYPWVRLANKYQMDIQVVKAPRDTKQRGQVWNELLLNAIDSRTAVVTLPHVHWADGTIFDLKSVRKRATAVGAYMIIDGTQSVGALPFSIQEFQPDALICACYKWLLGPYSTGLAYYGPRFDNGEPIEESWMNRIGSEDFKNLVNYQDQYKPLANRYCVGQQSNFILIPMLYEALEQIHKWGVENIQEYCFNLSCNALNYLDDMGCQIEQKEYRASHLFGIRVSDQIYDLNMLNNELKERQIYISFRGSAIRVAPHLYNTEEDINALVEAFIVSKRNKHTF